MSNLQNQDELLYNISKIVAVLELYNGAVKTANRDGSLTFTIPSSIAETREFKLLCYETSGEGLRRQIPEIARIAQIQLLQWEKARIDEEIAKLSEKEKGQN